MGGAEKTLKALHDVFPSAPIYTLFHNPEFTNKFIPGAEIRPSFLQKPYSIFNKHKILTPLMPSAIESFDLGEFDLVISSSVAFSKGLILKPKTKHICYCYSPTRQLWDWHAEYKTESGKSPKWTTSLVQHFLRIWDRHASTRVDDFISISENVHQRIKKYYDRNSTVIYPPVCQPILNINTKSKTSDTKYFLIVSRLYKHKNVDTAVKAFNKLGWPLVIIGDGPEYKNLKKMAGTNVKFLGYQPDNVVYEHYANSLAFIMPQEEDFGITPIESMGYGKPVLALGHGGALEYIQPGINGELFEYPTEEILADGVRRLKENINKSLYDTEKIKETAKRFSEERFRSEIITFLEGLLT